MTQSASSKDATHPSDGSSSRIRARTNLFMFSCDAGVRTDPLGTASGFGCHDWMSCLVCALPKVANVRVPAPGGVNAIAESRRSTRTANITALASCRRAIID